MIFAQRQKSKGLNSPVIIGGIGGSGTRVLTEILQLFGFFLGKDLNIALDNESFTLLFKHPSWLHQNINNPEIISSRLSLFKKAMTCTQPFTKNELQTLDDITRIMAVNGHNLNNNEGYGEWAYYRKKKIMVESGFREGNYTGWGWKEPNSYLLLDHYPEVFPGFRYIHVIRHGLDMAFSKNQNQLYNWGGVFGVPWPKSEYEEPEASFRFWVEANKRVLKKGEILGKKHFLWVSFDALCTNRKNEVKKIIKFLGIKPGRKTLKKAVTLPEIPSSTGRFRNYDISGFGKDDLDFLISLGYSIT